MCCNWDNFSFNGFICDDFNDEEIFGYGDKNIINIWWFVNIIIVWSLNILLILVYIVGLDIICVGDVVEYVVIDEGVIGNIIYIWIGFNGFMVDGQFVMVSEVGEYCVEVSDIFGCFSIVCKILIVLNFDDGSIIYFENLMVCIGLEVDFIVIGNFFGYSFSWSFVGLLGIDVNLFLLSFIFIEFIIFIVMIMEDEIDCFFI